MKKQNDQNNSINDGNMDKRAENESIERTLEEKWTEVEYKHQRRTRIRQSRPAPIKGEMDIFNMKIAEQQCCLFLSGLNPNTTSEQVKECIDETFKIDCKCEKMKTRKDKFKSSFKIYIPVDSKNKVLSGNMWGRGIVINHFLHLRRNFSKEANQVAA